MTKIKDVELDFDYVKEFIKNSSKETAIYIGCDSKVVTKHDKKVAIYVAVIVVHYDGNSGAKLFKMVKVEPDYGNMRQRLMREVYIAGEVGVELVEAIAERPFEIHIDVNSNSQYKSFAVMKEALGYIRAILGIEATPKPFALAASFAADRYAVQLADKGRMRT